MDWNIQSDFDAGDETINFGTRAFAESDGRIYEITTVATFKNQNQVSDVPALTFGYITNGGICVCVGNSLTVFADGSSLSLLFNMAFDAQIETFACSSDGNFLLVGLSNGFIQCLHIPSEGEPVYAKKLPTKAGGGRMFVKIIVDDNCPQDVLVVCASGLVINLKNFDFVSLNSALNEDNTSEVKKIISIVSSCVLCGTSSIAPVRSAVTFWRNGQLVIFAVGSGIATWYTDLCFSSFSEEVKWLECPSNSTLVKLQATSDRGLLLALSDSGQLVSVCPYTLMMRRLPKKSGSSICDFLITGNNNEVFVIAISSYQEQSNLSVLSLSGLVEKFTLPIAGQSVLMSTSCDIEDIHFLEFGDAKNSEASTLSLKTATQTAPKFRLERLLTRKKFEAAETLARNFGLDMSPVHQARAQSILNEVKPWNQCSTYFSLKNEGLLKSLVNELDKIVDLDFVTNCCVNAVPPDYHVAHSLLEYAQNRLELFFANNPELESQVLDLAGGVCSAMLRLETFNLLKPYWDVEEWLKFSHADLLRDVQMLIKEGALSEASVIWSRHKQSFKSALEDEHIVHYLLEEIPCNVTLDKVLEWVAHFLPCLLEAQPNTLSEIVSFLLLNISGLEQSHPREWPKISLDYSERTLKLISSQNQNVANSFIGLEASPLRPLVVLRCALANLHSLRSKYYIFVTLEEYSQPSSEVALLLLDNVDVGTLSDFITGYLNGYMLDHRLEADEIISQYINCVLENSDGWWYWEEAPWEVRIATLIPHITNYKMRLECITAALENAPVPWSSVMANLAEEGIKLKHPLCSLIREKQKQIGTNLILKKYGLKTHLHKIDKRSLLKYIAMQNHPDMLSDLAELSQKSVEDYVTVIMQLFYLGNTSKALEVLQKLPNDMIVQICPKLIHQLSLSLDLLVHCNIESELEFISAVAIYHEVAKASNPPGLDHIEDLLNPRALPLPLEEMKNRFRLKREFRKYLTVKEMSCSSSRESALKDIIQDLLMEVVEDEKFEDRATRLYHQSVYASRLLGIPTSLSLMELVEQSLGTSDLELAAYIAGKFDDMKGLPGSLYKKLLLLPSLFFTNFQSMSSNDRDMKTIQDISSAVYEVTSKVCSNCNTEYLQSAIEAFGWARVWHFVSGQQEISSLGQRDALKSWRFTPLYRDPGLAGFLNGSHLNEFLYMAFDFIKYPETNHDFIVGLTPSIIKLQNDQHDVAVITILSQVYSAIQRSSEHANANAVIEPSFWKSCKILLNKVAGARQFDKYLGLSLLTSMGQNKAFEYLQSTCKSTQIDFQRQRALSYLGTIVSGMWKAPELYPFFKLMSVQSTWGLQLIELGISAKELLRGKTETDIVPQKLIGSKNVTTSLLQALCVDYKLGFQDVLLQHLCAILLSWDPNPIISINSDGSKDVIIKNTQQQLLEECWEIQKNIKNKTVLCKTLCSVWEKVNFYHHEVFIVILEILERYGVTNQTNKRLITTFLKKYRRVKAPDQVEENFWAEVFPSSFGLPAMSEFRLPFNRRLIENPQAIVKHEVNLNTYKSWLSIASALDLSKDEICTIAVHQTVTEEFCTFQTNLNWCGTRKYEALFESIASCVAEMDDVMQATATLFFFTNKIPPGLDQVAAANLCVQYAEIVLNQTGETEFKIKMEKKYLHLATLKTLHLFGLGQPNYLHLAQTPKELIHALYQHPTIVDLCRGTASHSLDINSAVEEICKLHSLSLKNLHVGLVSEWLQPDIVVDCNTSLDDDCFGSMSVHLKRERDHQPSDFSELYSTDDNIFRARYVMEHGNVEEWALFLMHTAYQEEVCTGMRLRAMQCLCMLTDNETLEDISARPISTIRKKLRTLAYLKNLEILGLTYSEPGFESCDKKELATLILRAQPRSPRAVSMLVHLCVDFNISHMSLWNSIFQQLVDLNLMKELEQALSHTSEMYQLWSVPAFKKAWNLLLTSPFSKANFSSDHECAILHALTLFPTCPVMKCIDVNGALETCIRNQRPEIAALLLPYVDKSMTSLWQEKILAAEKLDTLLQSVKKISADRCINTSKILTILCEKRSCSN